MSVVPIVMTLYHFIQNVLKVRSANSDAHVELNQKFMLIYEL